MSNKENLTQTPETLLTPSCVHEELERLLQGLKPQALGFILIGLKLLEVSTLAPCFPPVGAAQRMSFLKPTRILKVLQKTTNDISLFITPVS